MPGPPALASAVRAIARARNPAPAISLAEAVSPPIVLPQRRGPGGFPDTAGAGHHGLVRRMSPTTALALRRLVVAGGALAASLLAHCAALGDVAVTPSAPVVWIGLLAGVTLVGRRRGVAAARVRGRAFCGLDPAGGRPRGHERRAVGLRACAPPRARPRPRGGRAGGARRGGAGPGRPAHLARAGLERDGSGAARAPLARPAALSYPASRLARPHRSRSMAPAPGRSSLPGSRPPSARRGGRRSPAPGAMLLSRSERRMSARNRGRPSRGPLLLAAERHDGARPPRSRPAPRPTTPPCRGCP